MPGKGRATAYSDFYKNREKTPENRETEDDEKPQGNRRTTLPVGKRTTLPVKVTPDRRKAALQRRLAALRKGK